MVSLRCLFGFHDWYCEHHPDCVRNHGDAWCWHPTRIRTCQNEDGESLMPDYAVCGRCEKLVDIEGPEDVKIFL